jgi:hypothetical protein
VLERVIKSRYETLSKNFAETNATFERLALKSVRENNNNKKIIKDNNKLWRIVGHLKTKVKLLKAKIATHPDLHVLAKIVKNLQEDQSK